MSRRIRKHGVSVQTDVVIVTGGRWDTLKECLDALPDNVNVFLIDNASDAEERISNAELFEGLQTKRLQKPLGYAAANNEGARMGSAPYILFLNDDCILREGAIDRMVETLKQPEVGIVGAKLTFPATSTHPNRPAGKVQHVGLALNIRGEVVHPLVGWSPDNPKTCVTREVWGVTGACLMTKRQVFNRLGGFEVAYGMGTYEDADYCLKVRSSGLRIILNADAVATHYAGATAEKKQVSFPLAYNAMVFKSRWLNSPLMSWGSPNPNDWVGEANFW
jgi:GT2 family glycosyltransferase